MVGHSPFVARILFGVCLFAALPAAGWHYGYSPIDPPEPDDVVFVVDRGGNLDYGCTYRSGSPLRFSIPVDRYIGPTNPDGTLKDVATLVANGIVSPTVRLLMPAGDVDNLAQPPPPLKPEIDKISFNGHDLGMLTGLNNVWVMQEFEIPIEWVKFPSAKGQPGSKPIAAMNDIRIDIDVENTFNVWCTGVDWGVLQFRAMAPIFFVHGIAADETTWDAAIATELQKQRIPFEIGIRLGKNATVDDNSRQLAQTIHDLATSWGVRKVHIVAHSKGGLDTRRFLANFPELYNPYDDIRVLSLHTLSTPHHGAVVADLVVAHRTLNDPYSTDPRVSSFFRWDNLLAYSGTVPQLPGVADLQVSRMLAFNRTNLFPLSTVLYTYGADADLNHDGAISAAEAAGLIDTLGAKFGTMMYRMLRDVSSITVERKTSLFGLIEWHMVTPNPTTTPQVNDIAVTDVSSMAHPLDTHFGPLNRNHGNVKDLTTIQNILATIRSDYPVF